MKNNIKTLAMWLIIGVIFIIVLSSVMENSNKKMKYSDLITKINEGKVEAVQIESDGKTANVELSDDKNIKQVNIPNIESFMNYTEDFVKNGSFTLEEKSESIFVTILGLLTPFGLLIIFFIFWFIMMGGPNSNQAGGKTLSFGKSKARMMTSADKNKVTFDDVAGVDEEKEELEEIVQFLKNPKKFTDMGARIPKGVLLVGQPGTGKTLIAKAIAGEADVPFISMSGSEFIEMFAGLGASRVRKLFEKARKLAPCIVFIDEIDAIGSRRTSNSGAETENNQTLNQLLVEMDGFSSEETIIVLAATNRPEMLDKALLRPGRFDRQITIPVPDLKGRLEILKIHARDKKISDDVNLESIAEDTAGFTGAELENILNEAAIVATKNKHEDIENLDIEEAVKKVTVGLEKRGRVYSEKDKKLTAYHEAGHAVVSRYLPTQTNVKEISIIPRGVAGGYTMYKSDEDKYYISKTEMQEKLIALLGGRAAEKLVLNDISTGASNDIEVATKIARDMVTKYGMSDNLGPIDFQGKEPYEMQMFGENIGDKIGEEVKKLIDIAYSDALSLLQQHRDKLDMIAQALLEKEKINEEDFQRFFEE